MVAPRGVSGVQAVPNAGQSLGRRAPCRISPLMQFSGSRETIPAKSKMRAAS